MFFTGLGTAVPATGYSQSEGWECLQRTPAFHALQPRSRAILRKILLGQNGIERRHLALDRLEDAFDLSPDTLHARFVRHAPNLASQAGQKAIQDARIAADHVDAVIATTCTGYLCPGLTSHLSERLQLRPNVLALDLVGLGCGAALPALQTASALIGSGQARRVLVVCAEVCSAAFFLDDDPGVLVSACLFGDGAAAALVSAEPVAHTRRLRWHSMDTRLIPSERESLRFETSAGMLRNILTLRVPEMAAAHAAALFDSMSHTNSPTPGPVTEWILHAGGRDVLVALQRRLVLPESSLRHSFEVLREHGNISSPSVLFALAHARDTAPDPGWWWMSSFGAGFTCHGAWIEAGVGTGPSIGPS